MIKQIEIKRESSVFKSKVTRFQSNGESEKPKDDN